MASLSEAVGKPSLPVAAPTTGTLVSLDPARDILLDLLAAALNFELADAWAAVVPVTPVHTTDPVADKVPFALTEQVMQSRVGKFPMLSVSRAENEPSAIDEFTLWQWRLTQQWDIEYVLGPLTVGDERRLTDILPFAAKVILLTVRQGRHDAYASGALKLGTDGCGFSSVRVVRYQVGTAKFADQAPIYHAMSLRLETTELTTFADAPNNLTGASLLLNPDVDEDQDPELLRAQTEYPPT